MPETENERKFTPILPAWWVNYSGKNPVADLCLKDQHVPVKMISESGCMEIVFCQNCCIIMSETDYRNFQGKVLKP